MDAPMLDLYTWHTPNGRKPAILLAELELPYELHLVDIMRGDQKDSHYLALNPNGKIPTLVDRDPHLGRAVVFDSCAILQYLADKYRRFIPTELGGGRAHVLSWLHWQGSGPGPIFGQLGKLVHEKAHHTNAYEIAFREATRLVSVLDRHLEDRDFIAVEYSIADIACFAWFSELADSVPALVEDAHEVRAWLHRIGRRPAVRRGMRFEHLAHAA